jgi:hypothetical protein
MLEHLVGVDDVECACQVDSQRPEAATDVKEPETGRRWGSR